MITNKTPPMTCGAIASSFEMQYMMTLRALSHRPWIRKGTPIAMNSSLRARRVLFGSGLFVLKIVSALIELQHDMQGDRKADDARGDVAEHGLFYDAVDQADHAGRQDVVDLALEGLTVSVLPISHTRCARVMAGRSKKRLRRNGKCNIIIQDNTLCASRKNVRHMGLGFARDAR